MQQIRIIITLFFQVKLSVVGLTKQIYKTDCNTLVNMMQQSLIIHQGKGAEALIHNANAKYYIQ